MPQPHSNSLVPSGLRSGVSVVLWLLLALAGCQSTSATHFETPHPLTIGVMLPEATLPADGSLGSAVEWQHQIASYLTESNVGVNIISVDPNDPDPTHSDSCDILVQPIVHVSGLGKVSNNAGAVLSNVVWLTTYVGYFFFADMSVDSPNKIGFRVFNCDGAPKLADSEEVKSPELDLTFGERDEVFSSRFFMTLILFPALHPFVCDLFGIDASDRVETAKEVRSRLTSSLASGIAGFVDSKLSARLEASKLPHLLTMRARSGSAGGIVQLTISVQSPTGTPLTALFGEERGKRTVTPTPPPAPQSWEYQFELGDPAKIADFSRLSLLEASGYRVTYTIPKSLLLRLVNAPLTELKNS